MRNKRIEALKEALDDEVHGLWISDEMAVKILARLDAISDGTQAKPPMQLADPIAKADD